MRAVLIVLLCAVAAYATLVDKDNVDTLFQFSAFQQKFQKVYRSSAEYDTAFHNFQATLKRLAAYKAAGKKGFGVTKFADLSTQEFRAKYLMPKGTVDIDLLESKLGDAPELPNIAPPAQWDWGNYRSSKLGTNTSAISPVKDQQQCGSCWAFSTTENFESMTFLAKPFVVKPDRSNFLPILGPQQLVDCDPQSQGCGGGWTYWAFEYLLTAGGQESEANYPYTAENGNCAFDATKIDAKIANYSFAINPPCEDGSCPVVDDQLRVALQSIGPLSVCVNAETWSDWTGPEPMAAADCPGDADELDHCVQLTGYNWNDPTYGGYWILRNSWNTNWGQSGFMFLATGGNTCGLGDVVTYANVPGAEIGSN